MKNLEKMALKDMAYLSSCMLLMLALLLNVSGCTRYKINKMTKEVGVIPLVAEEVYTGNEDFWNQTQVVEKSTMSLAVSKRIPVCIEHGYLHDRDDLVSYEVRKKGELFFYLFEVNPHNTEDSMIVYVFDQATMKFVGRFYLQMV